MHPRRLFLLCALGAGPFLAGSAQAASRTEVDVVVDMTPEGRKAVHPSPEHPAYYLPVVGGYQEQGSLVAGEKPPPPRDVAHLLAVELAKQGYLVMNPTPYFNGRGELTYADGTVITVPSHPRRREPLALNQPGGIPLTLAMTSDPASPYSARRAKPEEPGLGPPPLAQVFRTVDPVHGRAMRGMPSLILVIHWGYMNPEIDDFGTPDAPQKVFFNQNQMLALVGGNTLENLDLDFEREDVMQGAEQDRYFVMVTAYDFETYSRTHKKVMLWQAKMSVPSSGVDFVQVLQPLIQVGGPMLGHETTRPKMIMAPVTPEGKVVVGPLTVKDYQDAPTPPAPTAAPPPTNGK